MYTVLIAEDNEMNREILCSILAPCYRVVDTANGEEALRYLTEHADETAVVLLDLVMPVMDGFRFMKKRNNDPHLCDIPVIITSETEENSELMALRLGAERFVGKPYPRELLLRAVKQLAEYRMRLLKARKACRQGEKDEGLV